MVGGGLKMYDVLFNLDRYNLLQVYIVYNSIVNTLSHIIRCPYLKDISRDHYIFNENIMRAV